MKLRFNEAKATQAAARLLQLRGGRMHYIKLIKLLYLADREGLLTWGRPVTTDEYFSLDKGPIVSNIYNLITDESPPDRPTIWNSMISTPSDFQVQLLQDPPPSEELSVAEERLIDEIFRQYGALNRWALIDITHSLPEWKNPEGGAIAIRYEDILRAGNKSPEEIQEIVNELEELGTVQTLTSLTS